MHFEKDLMLNFNISRKIKNSAIALLSLLTMFNFGIYFYSESLLGLIIGQIFVSVYILDVIKTNIQFNIFQMTLLFGFFSLVTGSSPEMSGNYGIAFYLTVIHFFFLTLGYLSVKYEISKKKTIPKQSYYLLIYLLILLTSSIIESFNKKSSYSSLFPSFEETLNLPIYHMAFSSISGYMKSILIIMGSNPLVYSIISLLQAIFGYISSGIKGPILVAAALSMSVYQFYWRRITIWQLNLLLPFSIIFLSILIASTSFRTKGLGFNSFMSLNKNDMINYIKYFPSSPEGSQIVYTKEIIDYIENDESGFRYGWDFYRFFFYPVKRYFSNFEYASYNQFAHMHSKEKLNAGLYIGLAGELYWNFGYFFFIFSFLHGLILKRFHNFCFNGSVWGIATYLILFHTVLWHYYRGQANALVMTIVFYISGLIIFKFIFYKMLLMVPGLFRFIPDVMPSRLDNKNVTKTDSH